MDERVRWSHCSIILRTWTHNDGQDVVVKPVGEELLSDVILAVGVLKGQIELVVIFQHIKAVALRLPTGEVATLAIDIHLESLIRIQLERYLVTWIYLASLFA